MEEKSIWLSKKHCTRLTPDISFIRHNDASVLIKRPTAYTANSFKQQVRAWTIKCNAECVKINWQFKTQDARIKLTSLYPNIV